MIQLIQFKHPLTARCLLTRVSQGGQRAKNSLIRRHNPALKPPARYRPAILRAGQVRAHFLHAYPSPKESTGQPGPRPTKSEAYMPRLPMLQARRDTLQHRLSAQRREALSVLPWRKKKITKSRAGPNDLILSFPVSGIFPNAQASSPLSLLKLHAHTFPACWSGRAHRFSGPFQRFLFLHTTHPN
ncbi:Hypothetical_protein [Hexamita inflata]|uniref:Hypothetical_protein n=1 Tax=Hexamita inflata TaxID=28002 RepID=A0ABP1HTP2_9EUKA